MCVSNSTILKGYVSRLKYSGSPLADQEYRQLRVEIEKNKIYGVNILLYERVQVEQIDMDVSSSEDESNIDLFEDTDIDIKEEKIKMEYNQEQGTSEKQNINNCVIEQSKNYDKNSELEAEIIDIKEESIIQEKDICFVEVKHEFDSNLCAEPEHILPDMDCTSVTTDESSLSTNLTASKSNILPNSVNSIAKNTEPGSEVNLLNIINAQISHFLTTDGKNTQHRQVAKKSTTSVRKQPSTLRSLLESSTVAQSYIMQSFKENHTKHTIDDDIECISSDSETNTRSVEHSQCSNTKSKIKRHSRVKRKVNNVSVSSTNNSLPVINNIASNVLQPGTNIIEPIVNSIEPSQQYINTYPEVTQNYPLLTDNLSTTVPAENFILPYPGTAEPTNTFLIIYDDINPPAPPLVANTETTSSFILPKSGIVQNTVPFDSSTVVPSASTVPLVINSDTNSGFMLPTSSLTYHSENSNSQFMPTSNFVQDTGVSCQNVQGCSYNSILPTTEDETSLDSEPNKSFFICPICKKSFSKNKYLKQHFETHYLVTHKCNVCAKSFMNEKTLKAHILMHKGGLNYQCDYCSKMFAELSEFKKHSSIHVGVKQFECSVCDKRFIKRSSLTKHLASHNDGNSHKCTECNQVFQYKCRLEKHMLKQHSLTK